MDLSCPYLLNVLPLILYCLPECIPSFQQVPGMGCVVEVQNLTNEAKDKQVYIDFIIEDKFCGNF